MKGSKGVGFLFLELQANPTLLNIFLVVFLSSLSRKSKHLTHDV